MDQSVEGGDQPAEREQTLSGGVGSQICG